MLCSVLVKLNSLQSLSHQYFWRQSCRWMLMKKLVLSSSTHFQPSEGSCVCLHVTSGAEVDPPPLHHPQRAPVECHRLPVHQPGARGRGPQPGPTRLAQELDVVDDEPRGDGTFHPLVAAQHLLADVALRQVTQLVRRPGCQSSYSK